MSPTLNDVPHRRRNPLTGEWVLVSPHRTKRPWQGRQEPTAALGQPRFDPKCYLCPGNERAGGARNPDYAGTYVFDNDFMALLPQESGVEPFDQAGLLTAEPETGLCRVICYSPRHDLSLCRMDADAVASVIATWGREYRELGVRPGINHVQIFENRGQIMGCSNPHPHGQIWANATLPDIPAKEHAAQADYLEREGRCLLCRYLELERQSGERVVLENDSFAVLVPYWAVWPFEVMILPKRHRASLADMDERERADLAQAIIGLGVRYDNLFSTEFPYSMGIHQQPTDGRDHPHWHWHMHYYPPLLRSSTVRKFMVGYEMLAMPQRDITAEQSAARLREQPARHYLDKEGDA